MILHQLKDGYRYNSDSLILYDFVCKIGIHGNVLDLGSGCGIIGLLLKRDFEKIQLFQIDLQEKNAFINEKNAKINSIESTIVKSDFLKYEFECKFDYIVSNPPFYIDSSVASLNEHLKISKINSFLPIDKMLKKASSILKPRGEIIFCYDAKQIQSLLYALKNEKFNVKNMRFVHSKKDKSSNLLLIEAAKSSKSFCNVLPPLYVCDGKEQYSKEAKDIFLRANTKSCS